MSSIVPFSFGDTQVRVIDREGNPWFVAADIAKILGFRDAPNAIRILDEDEKDTHNVSTLGGQQEVVVISESGLYALILKSRKPEAKPFRKWVTSEVLPTIHKTGQYQHHPVPTSPARLPKEVQSLFDFVNASESFTKGARA